MTREEAIQVLQTALTSPFIYGDYAEAIAMAIEALQVRTEGDLISRQDALMDARPEYLNPQQQKLASYNQGWNDAVDEYYDGIKALPSADIEEDAARRIATIIENEQDMRVILKNAEPKTEMELCALADRSCPFQGKEYAWCLTCPHISEEDRALVKKAVEEPKTGWIPCSERLPEENVVVLTQAKFKDDIKMAVSTRQDYNYWTGWGTREVNIVAWMPLPEPYREDGEA